MHRWHRRWHRRWSLVVLAAMACSHPPPVAPPPTAAAEVGPHREQVAAQVQPFLDAELVSGLVIGLYDAGKTEIHGFGTGPGGKPPDGTTLFELGPVTKVYTSLLLADAVQRREIDLDTPVAEILPPGVTVPIRDKVAITLRHLVLHTAGLPKVPPSFAARRADNPYGGYGEDALYHDLIRTELIATPGTQIAYSSFGVGVLGFALGRKLGGGYPTLIVDRVLRPLELKDTVVTVPDAARARRAQGTTDDLAPAPPWTFDALAGAAALVSSVRDQLRLIELELDAASGGSLVLRRAMKLTQEAVLDRPGNNEGMGWLIDSTGRYWHSGGTGGFHAFVGFDVKTRRGVVVLAATATATIERLAEPMYKILDNQQPPPVAFPTPDKLAPLAGTYELSGAQLQIVVSGKRLYLEATDLPRQRLSPISDREFWSELLQSVVVFEQEGDKVARVVFGIGNRKLSAVRVDAK